MDVIDLYQIHWPEPDEDIEEGWGAMMRLKEEGKIRWAGVSNFSVAQMKRALPIGAITSLQPPSSLLVRDIEAATIPFCAEHNIGILCYSPMHSGLWSGGMTAELIAAMAPDDRRRNRPQFQEPLLSRNLALVELLRAIGARHGKAPGEVAIAWALHRPEVTAAIVGLRSPAQLTGVIGAGDLRLSTSEVEELEGFLAKQQ